MAIKRKWIKDEKGNKIYPVTHADSVFYEDGQTVRQKITAVDSKYIPSFKGEYAAGIQYFAGDIVTTSLGRYTHMAKIDTININPTINTTDNWIAVGLVSRYTYNMTDDTNKLYLLGTKYSSSAVIGDTLLKPSGAQVFIDTDKTLYDSRGQVATLDHTHNYLPLTGSTLTGNLTTRNLIIGDTYKLTIPAKQYSATATSTEVASEYQVNLKQDKITATSTAQDNKILIAPITQYGQPTTKSVSDFVLSNTLGEANGIATLDVNKKLTLSQVPDFILGQLLNAGSFNATTFVASLTTNGKSKLGTANNTITLTNNTTAITGYTANQDNYYIVTNSGTFAGLDLQPNDWLIANASGWNKVDNTCAVTSVGGKTGAVIITKSDISLGNVPNLDTTLAVNNQHTHANKLVLDSITASFTTELKTKLDSIATGAQVNTVTSVAGKTNIVLLDKTDVGLSDVDNTSDANKSVAEAYAWRGVDTRSIDSPPNYYQQTTNKMKSVYEFKGIASIGLSGIFSKTYCYVQTLTPWGDSSGGYPVQIATQDSLSGQPLMAIRCGSSSAEWSTWKLIANTEQIPKGALANKNTIDSSTLLNDNVVTISKIQAFGGNDFVTTNEDGRLQAVYLDKEDYTYNLIGYNNSNHPMRLASKQNTFLYCNPQGEIAHINLFRDYLSNGMLIQGNVSEIDDFDSPFGTVVPPINYNSIEKDALNNEWDRNKAKQHTLIIKGNTNNDYLNVAGYQEIVDIDNAATWEYFSSKTILQNNYNLITTRSVLTKLPYINNSDAYTNNSTFYAPTIGGSTSQILRGNGINAAPTWNTLSDSSSAHSLSSSDTSIPTVRDIYYGLPTINDAHAYTSSTNIYAPTSKGTASGQVLTYDGTSTPKWANVSVMPVLLRCYETFHADNYSSSSHSIAFWRDPGRNESLTLAKIKSLLDTGYDTFYFQWWMANGSSYSEGNTYWQPYSSGIETKGNIQYATNNNMSYTTYKLFYSEKITNVSNSAFPKDIYADIFKPTASTYQVSATYNKSATSEAKIYYYRLLVYGFSKEVSWTGWYSGGTY